MLETLLAGLAGNVRRIAIAIAIGFVIGCMFGGCVGCTAEHMRPGWIFGK